MWQPIDLLVISGVLHREYEIFVLDAIAGGRNIPETLSEISSISPEIIFMLTSVNSFNEDVYFSSRIKKLLPESVIICSGEPVLFKDMITKSGVFDFAIMDFVRGKFIKIFNSRRDERLGDIIQRWRKNTDNYFNIDIPRHSLFPKNLYWMPFVRLPFSSLLTDFGCPYSCRFCNSNGFQYSKRELDETIEDVREIAMIGYRHVFIKDMTFLIDRDRCLRICEEIAKYKLTFNFYTRSDLLDYDLLRLLKKLGLRSIQIGVESFENKTLVGEEKALEIEKIYEIFEYARELGIYSGAHFIIGLPSETSFNMIKFLRGIMKIRPSYISVNIFSRRIGSYYFNKDFNIRQNKKDLNERTLSFLSSIINFHGVVDVLGDLNLENFKWYIKNIFDMLKR